MPTLSYPGVFLVELDASPRSIEGVSTSTAGLIGCDVIERLQQHLSRVAPDWTDGNDHDPGVALLELAAWVTESLLDRTGRRPERASAHLCRLVAASLQRLADFPLPEGSALRCVRRVSDGIDATPTRAHDGHADK